jgi:hypothetical protein
MRRETSNPTFRSSVFELPFGTSSRQSQNLNLCNNVQATLHSRDHKHTNFNGNIGETHETIVGAGKELLMNDRANYKRISSRPVPKINNFDESGPSQGNNQSGLNISPMAEQLQKADKQMIYCRVNEQNMANLNEKRKLSAIERQIENEKEKIHLEKLRMDALLATKLEEDAKVQKNAHFLKEVKLLAEEKRIIQEQQRKVELSYAPSSVGLDIGNKSPFVRTTLTKKPEQLLERNISNVSTEVQ